MPQFGQKMFRAYLMEVVSIKFVFQLGRAFFNALKQWQTGSAPKIKNPILRKTKRKIGFDGLLWSFIRDFLFMGHSPLHCGENSFLMSCYWAFFQLFNKLYFISIFKNFSIEVSSNSLLLIYCWVFSLALDVRRGNGHICWRAFI